MIILSYSWSSNSSLYNSFHLRIHAYPIIALHYNTIIFFSNLIEEYTSSFNDSWWGRSNKRKWRAHTNIANFDFQAIMSTTMMLRQSDLVSNYQLNMSFFIEYQLPTIYTLHNTNKFKDVLRKSKRWDNENQQLWIWFFVYDTVKYIIMLIKNGLPHWSVLLIYQKVIHKKLPRTNCPIQHKSTTTSHT